MRRVALVPGALALLPEYAGRTDPVAELRAACVAAVRWLEGPITVVGDPQGSRVGRSLLAAAGAVAGAGTAYLVVGNGSACRSEKAPGFLDERAADFDRALGASLAAGEVEVPDRGLGRELLASLDGIACLPDLLRAAGPAQVDYDDDPFGVQYWVMRWQCAS